MSSREKLLDLLSSCSVTPEFPSTDAVSGFCNSMFSFLFPVIRGKRFSKESLAGEMEDLRCNLESMLSTLQKRMERPAAKICNHFFDDLLEVRLMLQKDAKAILMHDPAARSLDEVQLSYPGFYAICIYRLAHSLFQLGVPLIPRMMTEYAHARTGIDIHPGAKIGHSFFIDHGTGIVIGETTVIGDHVKLYQGVTLGALQVKKSMASEKRHPSLGDHVVIYAGSTILGGKTEIGHHSVIGGNVWLTESVPPYSLVYHESTVKIRKKTSQTSNGFSKSNKK